MDAEIKNLQLQFKQDLAQTRTCQDRETLRVKYLGRNSLFNQIFAKILKLSSQEKASYGKSLNLLKQEMIAAIDGKLAADGGQEDTIDLTFPGVMFTRGSRHILTKVTQDICDNFQAMGFTVIEGLEIEDEWHNFTALNFPADHPSRDSFDTFYLDAEDDQRFGRPLLRCHTSPVQTRILNTRTPPIAVISPGRVYRPDQVDATHSFMFHQIEGFAVDTNLNFGNLKGVLLRFAQQFFSSQANIRMRPHFFPFTEPSAEVDVTCFMCRNLKPETRNPEFEIQKCPVCKGKGWIEILGCGMIHPNVLKACGIDEKKYKGFAFGMGVERIAMLKYGIKDIRLFYENDVRFLEQFYEV